MQETFSDPRLRQAIVHWQFDPQTWHRFLEFDEANRNTQDIRVALALLALAILLIGILAFLGAWGPVAGVGILSVIILFVVIVHFTLQRARYRGMRSRVASGAGDVYVTPTGIWANGQWFDWGFGTAWRLTTVTPVLADTGVGLPPGASSYLEFKCKGRAAGRVRTTVDKKWRVPVPRGKEDEAREVVKYFDRSSGNRDEFGMPAD